MPAWLPLALYLAAFIGPAIAADGAKPVDPLAVPTVVVTPTFPPDAPPVKAAVEIQVRGTITPAGTLDSPTLSYAPEHEAFAQAVRDVLQLWRFNPGVDETACQPKSSDGMFYVWFERKDGEPSVSVSTPARGSRKPNDGKIEFRRRPKIVYPSGPLRADVEGETILLAQIHRSGEMRSVAVRSRAILSVFDDHALRGFEGVSFEPFDPASWKGKETVCAEYAVEFCIRGGWRARVPNPKCQ